MKVPLSWIKEFIDIPLLPKELSEVLTRAGLEVEAIDSMPLRFTKVVVGKVIAAAQHPEADRLRIATVDNGTEQFQVVCGAPNCREGLITAFAEIGATLYDDEGKVFKIKKSKLRNVESCGMLCSPKELGFSTDHGTILELPDNWPLGTSLESIYGETTLDIALTPNLGHCMSILGVAREIAALLCLPLKHREIAVKEGSESVHDKIKVVLHDKDKALRFACRLVTGVTVAPSPSWLQKRLEACGIRPINNVVDIGNYVMLEMGQPLHLFDYAKISEHTLVVGSKTAYRELKTLDGVNRLIPPEALLICDASGPLSFAGIMGGEGSAITDTTRDILIEAAYFTPQAIRKSSKLLGLRSESSQRFEKGIDPNGIVPALNRAAVLLEEIGNGTVCHGIADHSAHEFPPKTIPCRVARVNQILGTHLSLREIASLLTRAHLVLKKEDAETLTFQVPTFRNDLLTEIDLIEEVARLHGYENIPSSTPSHTTSTLTHTPLYLLEKEVRSRLVAEGLQEFVTCDLISPAQAALAIENTLSENTLIEVLHPSSIDQSVLRACLLPGLLQVMKLNHNHSTTTVHGFEIGRIHFKEKESFEECSTLGIILSGQRTPHHFNPKPETIDFFDLKGILENLLCGLRIPHVSFLPSHAHSLHPGKQAKILVGQVMIGSFGEIHPKLLRELGLTEPAYFAEVNLHSLLPLIPKESLVQPISPYPGSERDWTVTVPLSFPVGQLLEMVATCRSRMLEKVYLLDLYKSDQIGKDRKNLTLRFFYRDSKQTIAFETVEKEHARIIQAITARGLS